jgi:hypothetical protein
MINSYGNKILSYNGRFYNNTTQLLGSIYSAYNADGNTNDSLGNYNGTFVGTATYSTGIIGNAFSLTGTNYVSLPTNTHNLTGSFTISLWLYLTSFSSLTKLAATYTTSGVQNGWVWGVNGSGAVTFNGYNSGLNVSTLTSSNGSISANTWTHLVLIYNAGTNVRLYKNGTLLTTGSSSNNITYYTTFYPSIGANKYTASLVDGYFIGRIDAVNFWNRTIGTDEVSTLYNYGVGKQYPF